MFFKSLCLCTVFGFLVVHSENGNPLKSIEDNSKQIVLNATEKTAIVTAAEVDDLLHGGLYSNISHHNFTDINQSSLEINDKNNEQLSDIKWDTELIEDGTNTEDMRVKHYIENSSSKSQGFHYQLALLVLLACSSAVIVIGSITYFTWRKFEYMCWKKGDFLINPMDSDDMRHFSI